MSWKLFALILLVAATIFHLLAAFGVPAKIGWTEAAWACFTAAAFALLV